MENNCIVLKQIFGYSFASGYIVCVHIVCPQHNILLAVFDSSACVLSQSLLKFLKYA